MTNMREIKFRVWDVENKIFLNPIDCTQLVIRPLSGKVTDGATTPNVELSQYTGLKDKYGVEIYEGDILFHPLQGKRKVFYPYSETVASYGLRNVDNGMGSTLQDAHRVWEIIGNIYENPELLEEV